MPRMFTPAARAAAHASRQRYLQLKAEAKSQSEIDVFVVRIKNGFTWQIRQFGGVVIKTGEQCLQSVAAAQAKGAAVLAEMRRADPSFGKATNLMIRNRSGERHSYPSL